MKWSLFTYGNFICIGRIDGGHFYIICTIPSLKELLRDFPGGPVGKTLWSQCRGPGFGSIPGQGTRSRMHAATKTPWSQNKWNLKIIIVKKNCWAWKPTHLDLWSIRNKRLQSPFKVYPHAFKTLVCFWRFLSLVLFIQVWHLIRARHQAHACSTVLLHSRGPRCSSSSL